MKSEQPFSKAVSYVEMASKFTLRWLVAFSLLASLACNAQLNFNVDFNASGGAPLVKHKFAVYQTPLASGNRLNANMSKLSEANIKGLRYELGWGKTVELGAPQISGSASNPVYNWTELDAFINGLKGQGVTPLYALSYNPRPLQNNPWDSNSWQSVPNNMAAWQRICRDYTAHFTAMGTLPIYEIWNEPDLYGIFFTGNVNDYVNIYTHAVNGIRQAEPTAWVGGPAVSGANLDWYKNFLNGIGSTPITFLSGHIYNGNYDHLINTMRQALNETGRAGLPIYITEYSSFDNLVPTEIDNNGIASKSHGAARFFRDVRNLLTYNDVHRVYFAQWIDPEVRDCSTCPWYGGWDNMGMIDLSNRRKALYNAFKIYGWMPESRKAVSPEVQWDVGAMASSDNNNAQVVLWNTSGGQQTVNLSFNNLPFQYGKMEIYRIDGNNASLYDGAGENLAVLSSSNITGNTASLYTTIAGNGVLFVKMYRTDPPGGIVSGQVYRIVSRQSWKVLDVRGCTSAQNGATVQQWDWYGPACQKWRVEATSDGYYRFTTLVNNNVMDVAGASTENGADVLTWPYWGGLNQQWAIVPTDNGFYKVLARNSGKALDVSGCSSETGANVHLWSYWGGYCQQWMFEPVSQ